MLSCLLARRIKVIWADFELCQRRNCAQHEKEGKQPQSSEVDKHGIPPCKRREIQPAKPALVFNSAMKNTTALHSDKRKWKKSFKEENLGMSHRSADLELYLSTT
jgi:hypothetical protein